MPGHLAATFTRTSVGGRATFHSSDAGVAEVSVVGNGKITVLNYWNAVDEANPPSYFGPNIR
jgi:hypothetical protein